MTTATQTPVEAKWSVQKLQEETARVMASNCLAAQQVLSKYGEEAVSEYKAVSRKFRVDYIKSLGAKTPYEVAKAMAEGEANLFGSKIVLSGDEKNASLTYNSCGMWEALKKVGNLTPEQEAKMGEGFQSCMQDLAHDLNLKADVKMNENTCTVSFSK
jgi:hypothetical protein